MKGMIPIDVTDNYRMDKRPLGSLLDDLKDGKTQQEVHPATEVLSVDPTAEE